MISFNYQSLQNLSNYCKTVAISCYNHDMSPKSNQFADYLRKSGNSITATRQIVFETLSKNHPIGMAELVKLCSPVCDRASVYRTITLFEELDIVTKVNSGWKYKLELSDRFSDHHHHLTCTNCGKIVPINHSEELESLIVKLASNASFTSEKHQLEIHGLCSACQQVLRRDLSTSALIKHTV